MQFDAKVIWERAGQQFLDQRHDRAHQWRFDIANALKTDVRVEAMAL